jgi:hypothetical protein
MLSNMMTADRPSKCAYGQRHAFKRHVYQGNESSKLVLTYVKLYPVRGEKIN